MNTPMTITIDYDEGSKSRYYTVATVTYTSGFLWWKKTVTRRAFGGLTVWHWEDTGKRCSISWESVLGEVELVEMDVLVDELVLLVETDVEVEELVEEVEVVAVSI